MTSSRPYLIRALYEWISDNDCTPYLLVNSEFDEVVVPTEYIEDGKIVLNISMGAVSGLELGDEVISFSARFSGKSNDIFVPIGSVLALYARENGQGMMFAEEEDGTEPPDDDSPTDTPPTRPSLRVVK
ncbi:ClpXP protease specificity-enhancing factor [Solemya pervernicosa gill symbiont]|uniref:ClpXP protease specificity-enhancing factor n=2 Tax=Gammaproteobacteria incertae sedis TaxID=118884 RepID=A0A1T2LA25_9GAMM|nr:ClpXP protease specificity-enhancing factor [Candidatus Reidiella endopervernicosa]OOZ41862.1 ClpXP protease specificity-enhancing factor [Solemya pervernicosa gill symbiont]QKQ26183.1 ClpXP protease specificity-enhancing factor [Candidatus Reidiella endopervernicosa]